jgi:hypothetical protein
VYQYYLFIVVSTSFGESRPVYGGLFTVGGYDDGYFFQYGWPHNLRVGPLPAFLFLYINSTTVDRSSVGSIIQHIKSLASNFESISFSHVRRQCNESAPILARLAKIFISSTLRNFAPDFIRQILGNDLL